MQNLEQLNDDAGLARDLAAASEGKYLGSLSTVEEVLRAYLADILLGRADHIAGKITQEGFQVRVIAKAKWVQDVIYGRVEGYSKARWSGPTLIGVWLVNSCQIGGDINDAVERLMGRLFREFVENYVAFESDQLSEYMLQVSTDYLVEFYSHVLCMLQPPPGE